MNNNMFHIKQCRLCRQQNDNYECTMDQELQRIQWANDVIRARQASGQYRPNQNTKKKASNDMGSVPYLKIGNREQTTTLTNETFLLADDRQPECRIQLNFTGWY